MASWSFFEGKTVDAALEKAVKKMGVPKEKLKYEVDFAGSSGIFGLVGAKNAKIRVAASGQQSGSEDTGSTAAEKERQEILSLVDETFGETKDSQASAGKQPASSGEPPSTKEKEPASSGEPPSTKEKEPVSTREPAPEAPGKADEKPEAKYTEADFEAGKTALTRIVESIVTEATVLVQIKNNHVLFNVEGDNAAILIGKHGQTLKAMQHIVEKVVHKSCGERIRVMVDVEKYMEKRRASLKALATRLADKVKQTGKSTTINRMDAFERKIIHDTLRKDKSVKTRSSGGGEIRNVVIHPGKKNGRPKKQAEK